MYSLPAGSVLRAHNTYRGQGNILISFKMFWFILGDHENALISVKKQTSNILIYNINIWYIHLYTNIIINYNLEKFLWRYETRKAKILQAHYSHTVDLLRSILTAIWPSRVITILILIQLLIAFLFSFVSCVYSLNTSFIFHLKFLLWISFTFL